MNNAFDKTADAYDQWYETPAGRIILAEELACMDRVCPERCGRWLEVGVGTGRFASAMGIAEGIDPSSHMLAHAARRGVRTCRGAAEALPFPDHAFDGVLLALALSFVANAEHALRETSRVLGPRGELVIGFVPSDSPWGEAYRRKAAAGHPVYASARFRSSSETVALVEGVGFTLRNAASALFWGPEADPLTAPRVEAGMVAQAGFVALRFAKPTRECNGRRGSCRDR